MWCEPLAEKFPNLFSLSLNKDAYVNVGVLLLIRGTWALEEICSMTSLSIWPQF